MEKWKEMGLKPGQIILEKNKHKILHSVKSHTSLKTLHLTIFDFRKKHLKCTIPVNKKLIHVGKKC